MPIAVPDSVKVEFDANRLTVEGPRGRMERVLPAQITVRLQDGTIVCERPTDGREHRSMHGLTRTLVSNMVTGVSTGFTKQLELRGVGYRAAKQGDELVLNLGYSHQIRYTPPPGITIEVADQTHFSVSGNSREEVGQVAANLRKRRPPEPYKGKGVAYVGEVIRRKAGKAGKGAK